MANIACLGAQERVFGSNPGVRPGFTTNNNVSCCSLLLSNVQCNNALRAIFLATLTLFLRNLVLLCFLAEQRQRLEGVFGFLERKQCNQPNAAEKSLNIQIQSPCKQIRKQMHSIGTGCTRIYDFGSLPYSLCLS